jgi:outer membrane protein assembly factor BamB
MARTRTAAASLVVAVVLTAWLAIPGEPASASPAQPIDWPTYGFDLARNGFNPNEAALTPATVPDLKLQWSTNLGGAMIAQPVVAAGVLIDGKRRTIVYEGTERGDLVALDAANGKVVWRKDLGSVTTDCGDMPGGVFGIGGAAAVDRVRGNLYAVGGDGAVHAFGLASGDERPHWPVTGVFDPAQIHDYGGLTLDAAAGRLYVTFAGHCDIRPYHGKVTMIDVATHAVKKEFYPSGPRVDGGGIWGPGGVSVDTATHHVFTATGNAKHHPESFRYSEDVVELSATLLPLGAHHPELEGYDTDFGATPLLFDVPGCPGMAAAMNKTGALFVYRRGAIGDGPLQRIQVSAAVSGHFQGIPAYSPLTRMVYLTDDHDSPDGTYHHGLVAFHVGTGCRLTKAWQRTFGDGQFAYPPPTVGRDVVYAADGTRGVVRAFVAGTGRLLWSTAKLIGGPVFAAPTVVDGMVLVPSWDGRLYCFGL